MSVKARMLGCKVALRHACIIFLLLVTPGVLDRSPHEEAQPIDVQEVHAQDQHYQRDGKHTRKAALFEEKARVEMGPIGWPFGSSEQGPAVRDPGPEPVFTDEDFYAKSTRIGEKLHEDIKAGVDLPLLYDKTEAVNRAHTKYAKHADSYVKSIKTLHTGSKEAARAAGRQTKEIIGAIRGHIDQANPEVIANKRPANANAREKPGDANARENPGNSDADDYAFFGLSEGATPKELRTAYKKLAVKMHPDKNLDDPDATSKFQDLSARFERLKEKMEH